MNTLSVMINGRDYQVACDAGQEQHVRMLADGINDKVQGLASKVGQAGDSMLLLLASLTLADELHDTKKELSELKEQIGDSASVMEAGRMREMEKAIASTIGEIASRIEKIADHVERR